MGSAGFLPGSAARYRLGCCWVSGEGVEHNCTKAVRWYRKAAEQEDAHAKEFLKLRERPGMAPA